MGHACPHCAAVTCPRHVITSVDGQLGPGAHAPRLTPTASNPRTAAPSYPERWLRVSLGPQSREATAWLPGRDRDPPASAAPCAMQRPLGRSAEERQLAQALSRTRLPAATVAALLMLLLVTILVVLSHHRSSPSAALVPAI